MKISTRVSTGFIAGVLTVSLSTTVMAANHGKVFADFPVTVKQYDGDKKSSVSYSGQIARHTLHNSLKKLAGSGNGSANAELEKQMLAYYDGSDAGRDIIDPKTKGKFVVKQSKVDELSKGKSLAGNTYKGTITGWPGNMTGPEMVRFMIGKASSANKGYDPLTGYDYSQLISKFIIGAVLYNQIVDKYLDEYLEADKKPNNAPYKEGAYYTGKEHAWDEGWGYFGAPAHTLTLSPDEVYAITKQKDDAFAKADANNDGLVDLKSEMAFGLAYYAAGADRSGKTNYLHTITKAFIDGRQLIADAKGEALSDQQRAQLKGYAKIVADNLEKVLAEAAFKYAGSVYRDLQKLKATVENNGDASEIFRAYAKHWGELKGFSLALQTGNKNLGETAVKLNRMIGFSPVLLGNTQVDGIDADGNYTQSPSESMEEYMLHMLKVQKLLVDQFDIQARANDALAGLGDLTQKLGSGGSVEND